MSRSIRRGPDQWASPHERARYRAAQRLAGPIDPAEDAWLGGHLDHCPECRTVADEYEQQRLELRAYRGELPEPPRDLWARTAAAIEAEAQRSPYGLGGRRPARRSSALPLAAASGVLVVVLIVGLALLSGRSLQPRPGGPDVAVASSRGSGVLAAATPLTARADVTFVKLGHGGGSLYFAPVREVCPKSNESDCAPIAEPSAVEVPLPSAAESVIKSPTESEIVVISAASSSEGGSVTVVPVPTVASEPTEPPESTAPPGSSSPTPSESTAVATPSIAVTPGPDGQVAIIDRVITDPTAAYSPDGRWFAFSARPASGEQGPDVYLVRAGDTRAVAVTDDHRSVFASWADGLAIASRTTADGGIESVAIDPATGARATVAIRDAWRPTVDSRRGVAVYWTGTVRVDPNGVTHPDVGQLVIGAWPGVDPDQLSIDSSGNFSSSEPKATEESASPSDGVASAQPSSASGSTEPVASSAESPEPSAASPSVGPSASPEPPVQVLATGPIADWDARWDESGTHLAVWVTDSSDSRIGRLTLYVIDPATRRVIDDPQAVRGQPALAGFAIGKGSLAFATPPGQDAKGSRVQVQAWTENGIGQAETVPGDEQVLVVR